MKFTTSSSLIYFCLLAGSTTSAFSPVTPRTPFTTGTKVTNAGGLEKLQQQQRAPNSPFTTTSSCGGSSSTHLSMADNSNNGNMEEWKQKAEDATQFLLVDIDQARNQLSQNWGWIVTSGVLTIALGTAAFLVPIFATGVAYNGTVLTLGATGLVSVIASIFAREHGQQQVKSALSGILYLGLSYYMGTHPQQGLDIITLTIATVIAAEGLYEAALAFRNENLEGRGWHAFSGIGSFIVGLALSANLPATGLVTPGYALGARLTSSGATKLAVGLTGKEIADDAKNKRNNL